jgi:hypothetical protein
MSSVLSHCTVSYIRNLVLGVILNRLFYVIKLHSSDGKYIVIKPMLHALCTFLILYSGSVVVSSHILIV